MNPVMLTSPSGQRVEQCPERWQLGPWGFCEQVRHTSVVSRAAWISFESTASNPSSFSFSGIIVMPILASVFKASCNGPSQLTSREGRQVSCRGRQDVNITCHARNLTLHKLDTVAVSRHDSGKELILCWQLILCGRAASDQSQNKQDAQ